MGFWGSLAKIGGTLGGAALYASNPVAGALMGSLAGSGLADVLEGEPSMPNLTGTMESPSTWMPLMMPQMSGGQLTPAAQTTIGSAFGAGRGKEREAALANALAAQRAKALTYMLMGQQGGGGGGMGGMSLPMMMMMQEQGKK